MQTEIQTEQTPEILKSPREVLLAWEDAYNRRDPFSLVELYADDAEKRQVALGDLPLRGREALLESFVSFFHAFADKYTNIENLFVDGEWTIVEWSGCGVLMGKLGDAEPTGRSFKLRAAPKSSIFAETVLKSKTAGFLSKQKLKVVFSSTLNSMTKQLKTLYSNICRQRTELIFSALSQKCLRDE